MIIEPGQSITIEARQTTGFYSVRSESDPDRYYVTCKDACTCPDYIYRGRRCKHMQSVMSLWYPEATFLEFLNAFREATRCNKCERLYTMLELAK